MRVVAAVVAFIAGGLFLRQAFWYDRHFDAIIKLPFFFGALIIGLLCIGFGVSVLLPRTPGRK